MSRVRFTYFLFLGRRIKIGSAFNPFSRVASMQLPGVPDMLVITTVITEKEAHAKFAEYRVVGEWFDRGPEDKIGPIEHFAFGSAYTKDSSNVVMDSKDAAEVQRLVLDRLKRR